MAWNWGFAKLHEETIILAEMSDSTMKAFTAAHTAVLSIVPLRTQQPMLVSFSHFLAVLLEEVQRPSLPPPSFPRAVLSG